MSSYYIILLFIVVVYYFCLHINFNSRYHVVLNMGLGASPKDAATAALRKISTFYPHYSGALIAVTTSGEYGAAYTGFGGFQYTVYNPKLGNSTVLDT